MRVISRPTLRNFWETAGCEDSEAALRSWYSKASKAEWQTFDDIKADFATASLVGELVVFNIHGNKYRLVVKVSYPKGKIYIRHVMSHREYDKEKWKDE
jgi:mRNA interferase HigB